MSVVTVTHSFPSVEFVSFRTDSHAREWSTSKPFAVLIVDTDDYFAYDNMCYSRFEAAMRSGYSIDQCIDAFIGDMPF